MRFQPESLASLTRPRLVQPNSSGLLLVVAGEAEAQNYAVDPQFARLVAHTTADAVQLLPREHPDLVVIDGDEPVVDCCAVCAAAKALASAKVLVATDTVQRVPAVIKAGCDAVLLKPFAPNLFVARLSRMLRESSPSRPEPASNGSNGTNRHWPDTVCPNCGGRGATSFDFASYRRAWYACLACDSVWLGRRQE